MGCHALLQGIFPNPGLNRHLLCLLHCRQVLHLLTHHPKPPLSIPAINFSGFCHAAFRIMSPSTRNQISEGLTLSTDMQVSERLRPQSCGDSFWGSGGSCVMSITEPPCLLVSFRDRCFREAWMRPRPHSTGQSLGTQSMWCCHCFKEHLGSHLIRLPAFTRRIFQRDEKR